MLLQAIVLIFVGFLLYLLMGIGSLFFFFFYVVSNMLASSHFCQLLLSAFALVTQVKGSFVFVSCLQGYYREGISSVIANYVHV